MEQETYLLLEQNKDLVEAIANELMERETLYAEDLIILSNVVFQSRRNTFEPAAETLSIED